MLPVQRVTQRPRVQTLLGLIARVLACTGDAGFVSLSMWLLRSHFLTMVPVRLRVVAHMGNMPLPARRVRARAQLYMAVYPNASPVGTWNYVGRPERGQVGAPVLSFAGDPDGTCSAGLGDAIARRSSQEAS